MNLLRPFIYLFALVSALSACDSQDSSDAQLKFNDPVQNPVQWARDKCGQRQYSVKSNLTVDDLISNVLKSMKAGEVKIPADAFIYVHLDYQQLVELYSRLKAVSEQGILAASLAFDLKDYMIRLSILDKGAALFFKDRVAEKIFERFDPESSEFHILSQSEVCPLNSLAKASIRFVGREAEAKSKKTLRIFHGALEAHNIRVGGVSSFITGLVQAENRHVDTSGKRDIESGLVTPFYDVLKVKFFDAAEFVGFIDHEIDYQHVRSTVYKVFDQGIEQYLIQADQSYKIGLYNIGEPSNLYRHFADEVWLYYSTALASFAALYRGPDRMQNIDVLQINDWHLGMTSAILAKELNTKRVDVGLPKVSTVATTHEVNEYQGKQIGSYLFRRVGLVQPPTKNINVQALFQVFSNASNTVSRSVAAEMRSSDPKVGFGLGALFSELHQMNRFVGITNGIDVAGFDPTLRLGELSIRPDFADVYEKKLEAKKRLYEEGLIGSPTKPLFLYVGRFSAEKGVDTFREFVRLVVEKHNGQVVIMGAKTDASVDQSIAQLESMSKDPRYAHAFRFYSNVKKDQLEKLRSVDAPKGLVIRFASDFTFVPSIQEACGLVPIEAMALGSGVFTSHVHGLKDLCKPLDAPDLSGCFHDFDSFTCATFTRHDDEKKTFSNLEKSIDDLSDKWGRLSIVEKRMAYIRWILEARNFEWDRENGAMDQYKKLYLRAMQPDTVEDEKVRDKLIKLYVDNY